MYVRRNPKKRADGSERVEVMLAHNVRVKNAAGDSVTKPIVIARLGNEEDVDRGVVDSMIGALERYREKRHQTLKAEGRSESIVEEVVAIQRAIAPSVGTLRVLASKQLGVRLVVERAWKSLGLAALFQRIQGTQCRTVDLERIVLAMIVNRLVDPVSKLACNDWVKDIGYFPESEEWTVDQFYRSLDVVQANADAISSHVADRIVSDLSEEDRHHLLMDTTSVFTEAAMDDVQRAEIQSWWEDFEEGKGRKPVDPRPQVVNEPPLRMRGKSKDHRGDAPQIVVGLTTTTDGRVVSHSVKPGNTSDKVLLRDLVDDALNRHPTWEMVVTDSGMAGKPNLRWLADREERPGWLCGVPVRTKHIDALLRRRGRWKQLDREAPEGRWTVRWVDIPEHERIDPNRPERLIAIRNPSRARRDRRKLERQIEKVEELIAKNPSPPPKGSAASKLSRPSNSRLLKWVNGKLKLDKERIAHERRRAGVKVLRTTLEEPQFEAVLTAYDELLNVENDFREFKTPLRIRPMYHRASRRIHAHVMMCFLALVCQQAIEREAGMPWKQIRKGLAQLHAVEMEHGCDTWWQRSEPSEDSWKILRACGVVTVAPRWVLADGPKVTWTE